MEIKAAGIEPGQRRLNGIQTTGRKYRSLSEPSFQTKRTNDVEIKVRDGTGLMADIFQPEADGRFPALLSFSAYPRQIQDLGAPLGFIEAGASDFFVPRGYVHVIANARGTAGSEGAWTFFDRQEREDLFDLVEWIAAQPWCDGNVGMLGISYFAIAQLCAAVEAPPHLKAVFPVAVTDDLYEAVWHHGLLSSGFVVPWLSAVGTLGSKEGVFWRGVRFDVARHLLNLPVVHERFEHLNGEAIMTMLKRVVAPHFQEEPFGRLMREVTVEHPVRDAFWEARDLRSGLKKVDIPVYLGCDWENVPLHLPSTFSVWKALAHNPNVRMSLLNPGDLAWPWESLHYEALAWYDHWLKGQDSGIMEGPPIRYVVPGADGWRTSAAWPPPESKLTAFALRADGSLAQEEGTAGSRSYLYTPADYCAPASADPPALPASLQWETAPMASAFDFAGNIELQLDATITALDAGWIAVLFDIAPEGAATVITAGWLRASLSRIDEERSSPGAPVVECRTPIAIPVGERVIYRMPLVANARRIVAGHRLRLVVASTDRHDKALAVMGFTHTPIGEASLNTVFSSSRLLLPLLPMIE